MIFYWFLFLAAALPAFAESRNGVSYENRRQVLLGAMLLLLLLSLAIGLRNNVGGDWETYLEYLDRASYISFAEALTRSDPGYIVLNWLSNKAGWGIIGVNLIGGAIFAYGLIRFCWTLPKFWLALAVAVPYLVIVVGMGYVRQGIAIGFIMMALVALRQKKLLPFLFLILLGATFHKTAIVMILGALVHRFRKRLFQVVLVAVAVYFGYQALVADSVDQLYEAYVEADYQSQGALIRLLMNAVPAVFLLLFYDRFQRSHDDGNLWRAIAVAALILLAAYFVFPGSSTAIDRLALYIIPLQLYVFSHLPAALAPHSVRIQSDWAVAILAYSALTMAVWLFFATHAEYWLPYRTFLF